MSKLRKMLGDADSRECVQLMRQIETQSHHTLAGWAIHFAKINYLDIYEASFPDDTRLRDAVNVCEDYLTGGKQGGEPKPVLAKARQIARDISDNPAAQAAARAVAAACSTIQTPTNALGFLFYGAAATAYSSAGLSQTPEVYDHLAASEFRKALDSLQKASVPHEQRPVNIKWNC